MKQLLIEPGLKPACQPSVGVSELFSGVDMG
jgi:hypothetical protein